MNPSGVNSFIAKKILTKYYQKTMKLSILALLITLSSVATSFAQQMTAEEKEKYTKAITERADKIVITLGISDSKKSEKVRNIIRDQYSDLNDIYTLINKKFLLNKMPKNHLYYHFLKT